MHGISVYYCQLRTCSTCSATPVMTFYAGYSIAVRQMGRYSYSDLVEDIARSDRKDMLTL